MAPCRASLLTELTVTNKDKGLSVRISNCGLLRLRTEDQSGSRNRQHGWCSAGSGLQHREKGHKESEATLGAKVAIVDPEPMTAVVDQGECILWAGLGVGRMHR